MAAAAAEGGQRPEPGRRQIDDGVRLVRDGMYINVFRKAYHAETLVAERWYAVNTRQYGHSMTLCAALQCPFETLQDHWADIIKLVKKALGGRDDTFVTRETGTTNYISLDSGGALPKTTKWVWFSHHFFWDWEGESSPWWVPALEGRRRRRPSAQQLEEGRRSPGSRTPNDDVATMGFPENKGDNRIKGVGRQCVFRDKDVVTTLARHHVEQHLASPPARPAPSSAAPAPRTAGGGGRATGGAAPAAAAAGAPSTVWMCLSACTVRQRRRNTGRRRSG